MLLLVLAFLFLGKTFGIKTVYASVLMSAAISILERYEPGLFSCLGLACKSLVIDSVIENINLCKCFTIVCDEPEPICRFIIDRLGRSATVYEAQGAFSHHKKTIIMTTMKRHQALKLRNYIRAEEPDAFILISNSSEIIGKGFLSN